MAIPTTVDPEFWKTVRRDLMLDSMTYKELYEHQFAMPESKQAVQGMYSPSDGEVACLESYAIQNFFVEDEDFYIELVHPERIPLEYFSKGRGILPRFERDVALFIYSVQVKGREIGIIKTEVGLWAQKLRLMKLWEGSYDEAQDPADVMSDGDEKWVSVHEERDPHRDTYVYSRGKPTTYKRAGGPSHDPSQQQGGPNGFYYSDCQWRDEPYYEMESTRYTYNMDPNAVVKEPPRRQRIRKVRRTLDRAHADEMFGPSASDPN